MPTKQSFIRVAAKHTILDTVKPSDDGEGIVLRVYESSGSRESLDIYINDSINEAYETNLLEEETSALTIVDQTLSTAVTPFEVKTIKVNEVKVD
nr:glycosyl hydrolase-related protein [Alkalicoccobacillus plakortidis]